MTPPPGDLTKAVHGTLGFWGWCRFIPTLVWIAARAQVRRWLRLT